MDDLKSDFLITQCKLTKYEAEQLREAVSKLSTYNRQTVFEIIRVIVKRQGKQV